MAEQDTTAHHQTAAARYAANPRNNRRGWRILGLIAVLGLLVWALAACGPKRSSQADLTAEAVRIAQEFAQTGDLARAQAQLAAIDVANPTQWLVLLAENRVKEQIGAAETNAIVRLVLAMGVRSAPLLAYAGQQGLLPATATPQTVAAALPIATPIVVAVAAGAAPAAVPAVGMVAASDVALPTATSAPVSEPTATPIPKPVVVASSPLNVRSGPGTAYPIVGALNVGEQAEILAKNPQSDWWQVTLPDGATGWVLGTLVQTSGDTASVAVASDIPAAPPTATPAPVAAAPVEQAPAESAPAEAAPTVAPAASSSDQPYFRLVEKRMWSKAENGDCRGQHLLRLHVLAANGSPLNGVALQGIYTGEILVTGSQGKGDGVVEYDLYGSGEGFKVIRDADGREAQSDPAEGFTTRSIDIPKEVLIAGGYCTNDADCQVFYTSYGCHGHHSWEATLQRNY
jgi:hypothetical protein